MISGSNQKALQPSWSRSRRAAIVMVDNRERPGLCRHRDDAAGGGGFCIIAASASITPLDD
jgi:hypothetical protein